jgi:2-aminoadipate transaminase
VTSPEAAPWSDADIERLLAPVARALPAPTSLSPLPYDLNAGVPDAASLPARELAEAAARALAADPGGALTYGGALGFEPLRAWIAERQAAETGLAVGPAQVMLTSGSAQAIDTVAATFLAPGDVVIMGAPTYPGAIRAFRARGARIVDVPQDADGLEMVGLASALEHQRAIGAPAKLVYVIANYDNPSGATLPLHRRQELALLAARYRALVVEDDAYTGIDLDGPPPTSLFAIMRGQGIIRVGTFSKTIATGLRVGWVVADAAIVRALAYMRFDNGSSPLVQRTVHEYLLSGAYDPHVAELREIYRERRDVAYAAVAEQCGELVHCARPAGGFFLWLQLAAGLEAEAVVRAAAERGVAVTPGRGYYAHGGGRQQLRLVYSALPPERLREAIALFGQAVAAVAGSAPAATPR